MAPGFKTGGRDFQRGHDPRRNALGAGHIASERAHRLNIFNRMVRLYPDAVLDLLAAHGLIPELVRRYETRKPRNLRHGGWPWAQGDKRRPSYAK